MKLRLLVALLAAAVCCAHAQTLHVIASSKAECVITTSSDTLLRESWGFRDGIIPVRIASDANFGIDLMVTDWRAPGKQNNADNPVILTKDDFAFIGSSTSRDSVESMLTLSFVGRELPLQVRVTYRLGVHDEILRRKIAVRDTTTGVHFLRGLFPLRARLEGPFTVVKKGDFGQPVAIITGKGGAFFGIEYPAAMNQLVLDGKVYRVECSQEIGSRIGREWIESEWTATGLTPNTLVKYWFMKYVSSIRVAPARPFTLYNSWYDLRSPEYLRVKPENVMNEENIKRMIGLIKDNMINRHHIALDAFVLDDGWDVYDSDWMMRKPQFPNGLKPIAEELAKTGTSLGMWFGPTGGYSFRSRRINWMRAHGYEIVGDQLCLAGKNYSALFQKRVTDLVANEGVSYFKWDGIQFSCSQPDHGHPIDIYSRRAVMESVVAKCRAVRSINPSTFLNITSGTWLSPWWVRYANQIWMDGEDYGYADVPSMSPRDAAITYRDFVLYDDFVTKDLWFPIANLMTHGIIKGKLEMLGGTEEPLEKFTNEALFYVARGVSMWELYISPDILTDGEWNAIGQSLAWGKNRAEILGSTFMIGGDPLKSQAYGYAHFKGSLGIIAVRNPGITPSSIAVKLSTVQGMSESAERLVWERVYPTRWIDPVLHRTGDVITVPLDGYEAAVYELTPIDDVDRPLLAGIPFSVDSSAGSSYAITVFGSLRKSTLLNPSKVASQDVQLSERPSGPAVAMTAILEHRTPADSSIVMTVTVGHGAHDAEVAFLLKPGNAMSKKSEPNVSILIDGQPVAARGEFQKGVWTWKIVPLASGTHSVRCLVGTLPGGVRWTGSVAAYGAFKGKSAGTRVTFAMNTSKGPLFEPPMPPLPLPAGVSPHLQKLCQCEVKP